MIVKLAYSAEQELDLIGMTADSKDEMNREMRKNILQVIKTFRKQHHSGFSASYAINLLQKLLRHEPLSPLTGKPEEWQDMSKYENAKPGTMLQNIRCSNVFKRNGKAFELVRNAHRDEVGVSYTKTKTSPIKKFPYKPKDNELL